MEEGRHMPSAAGPGTPVCSGKCSGLMTGVCGLTTVHLDQ